ncbi:MAG: hypothetical protein OK441_00110 [Thaumarchaeota archaeon]|nr:hypothetical protein [Nitrososphaerota archaeon]
MKTGDTPAQSVPKTKADGINLAREVVNIDNAILSLLVLDKHGGVLAMERSSRLSKSDYMEDKDLSRFGAMAKVIIGMAANAEPLMGRLEFIVGEFKNHKVVFMNLPKYEMTLALRMARSSNGEYLSKKIAEKLAISD